jgi:serine/threonine protein kinase
MDIAEVRKRFEAYAAGTSSGRELRMAVSDGLQTEPQMAPAYNALVSAYFRDVTTDPKLRDAILADIARVSADSSPGAPIPMSRAPLGSSEWQNVGDSTGTDLGEGIGAVPSSRTTGTGSAWDSLDRLNEPAETLTVGSVLKNRYELEAELGRGGMGVVYKALDRANAEFKDRSPYVAIKVLNDEFKRHPLAMQSLAREAKKALTLAHPNVVTVYNFARDGGNVFMVMELLEGRSLDQVLKSGGGLGMPRERVADIVQPLGAALSYAHEQGIVHADFKPSNAFLTNDGAVKVLDFGIARAAQGHARAAEKTVFDVSQLNAISPAYASLEMLNGEPPDVRDDVYALACVTYEILTGRHPFNRIDAVKAREAKLQPAPVRRLPRAQSLALRRGLAFERGNRTPSVAEFVSAFKRAPRSKAWVSALAVFAVAAVAAAVIVPRQLESYRAHQRAVEIAGTDATGMAGALARLRSAPGSFRDRVLVDDKARGAILAYYQSQIADLTKPPQLQFAKAQEKLSELRQLLPDSSTVYGMSQDLGKSANAELAQLMALRDRALRQSVLIPEQGPDSLLDVLALVRQIDPSHKSLIDPLLPKAYGDAAKSALDGGHPDLAHALVAAGVQIAPNDGALLDMQDRVDRELRRVADSKRQGELEQYLAVLNPAAPDFLDKVLASREDVTALASIAPDSPVVKRIESSLGTVVALRVKQRLAAEDVAGAQALMLNIGDLMPESAVSAQRDLILQAANASQSKAFDTLERLRRAVLTGRLGKTGTTGALDLYAQLQRAGSSSDVLADARDYLAFGYLKDARRARLAGDRQRAGSQLEVGRNFQPSSTIQSMLAGEQQQLDEGAKAGGAAQAAAPEIDAARGQFAQSLRSSSLGTKELAALALALDRLESLGASPQEISSGVSAIEDRVLQEVRRLKQQSGADPAQLAQQAAILLPVSDRLAEATKEFRDAAVASELKVRLDALLRQPSAGEQWAGDVKDLTKQLHALVPANDAVFGDARRIPAATFVKAALDARDAKRYKDETKLLAMAREFDPDARLVNEAPPAASPVRAKQEPNDSSPIPSSEQTEANKQRLAAIEALKQRLESQAEAGDVANAAKTANDLRTVLAGNIYVARDVPEAMISAYVHHAKSQFASGKIREALQTLANGERGYGEAVEIKSLQARYAQVADENDSLANAMSLNSAEHRRRLDALRAEAGAEYASMERMLAQTLANRIAEVRATGKTSIATDLLDSGRNLFPAYAASLEQGVTRSSP